MGHRANPAHSVQGQWQRQAREVRRLHERIFYRPLLAAVARLSPDEARLTPEAARERLSALGFHDPTGAMRHIAALTEGVSRRAAMQRTLLPVMLGWFADEADPDAGLLAFRRVSEQLGGTHWYLKMLRDSGSAAERLAHVCPAAATPRSCSQRAPEAALVLGDDTGLRARAAEALLDEVLAAVRRREVTGEALEAVRAVRRRELFRTSVADLVGYSDLEQVGAALTDITSAVVGGALELAVRVVEQRTGRPCRPGSPSSAWAGSVAASSATAATPTSSSSMTRPPVPRSRRRRRGAPPWCRSSAGCSLHPVRTRRSSSTWGCGPRARTGHWCAASRRTAATTSAGRWSGRPRLCCGRRRWPATPS